MVHRSHDHRRLADELNTLEALRQDPKMAAWIEFAGRQRAASQLHVRLGLKYRR
jgi:hypothetical protein